MTYRPMLAVGCGELRLQYACNIMFQANCNRSHLMDIFIHYSVEETIFHSSLQSRSTN